MPFHFDKWREAIQIAPNEKAVSAVIRDYVATINPTVLARISEESRSALLAAPFDVSSAAVSLLQEELQHRGDAEVGTVLHEMAHTFAAASVRLASLRIDPVVPSGS